ncbi:Nitroreductase [Desulfotomaculum arcticum]|uniref:Nitroreductase n=1 Tax=Desulfotruncus arcticus DSM 17038 TaxID=1121424 RepID=A0A1I2UNX6_9FIRM|nr:nitroreductase family protein [Desulfotruncus arcticus]SFG78852.1 Nitroreductase [Desulfotomaculum arcticum] [Desulfotruncus arcticus DSM 17038]
MSQLLIDREKCQKDGICVAECPIGIIAMEEAEGFPSYLPGTREFCIACGHCVAVCPHGALSLTGMPSGDCHPLQKELLLTPEQVRQFLTSRRSIRVYRDKPVDRETLQEIINVASYAPSGHNSQPVHWLVLQEKEKVRRFAALVVDWMRYMIQEMPERAKIMHLNRVVAGWEKGEDKVTRQAPHIVLVHARGDNMMAPAACTIAMTYLELAAYGFGLGACWAGYFYAAASSYPPMQEALELPAGHKSFGAMMLGYPKLKYHRIPLRTTPRINWR